MERGAVVLSDIVKAIIVLVAIIAIIAIIMAMIQRLG